MNLRETVRAAVTTIENGNIKEAKEQVEVIRKLIPTGNPFRREMPPHPPLTPDETIVWYAGEIVDIIDKEAWFAMNSIINCLNKFCPEVK